MSANTALAQVPQTACDRRNNNTYQKLLECVRVDQVREHQAALQEIADANGGNRFAGLAGYNASVDYVVETLEAAGWDVSLQEFDYTSFRILGPRRWSSGSAGRGHLRRGRRLRRDRPVRSGDVTAPVTAVDLQFGLGNTSTSGCESRGLRGLPRGEHRAAPARRLHLRAEGRECRRRGAVGIVIFNQGNTPDRRGIPPVTLTANNTSGIPVLGTTYQLGDTLADIEGLGMRVFANTEREVLPTANVIAERTGTNDDNVVMAGAHLDSVIDGPGINDNGRAAAPSSRSPSSSPREAAEHRSSRVVDRGGERPRRLDELRPRA